jgi:DNA phosphorothioation-associated putative methyltransferase
VDSAQFHDLVRAIPFGKAVNKAVYIHRLGEASLADELRTLLRQLSVAYTITADFNVLKFRLDESKISFLRYPEFFESAHPALREAITIDLTQGKSRKTDYSQQANPPILHRKETFLPADHERWSVFRTLTEAEEAAGLYENATTIGFLLNWERLLADKGLTIENHTLQKISGHPARSEPVKTAKIDRHRTALTRYDLSKPTKSLLQHGVLTKEQTFFDYGCGLGTDIKALNALGYPAGGWDPVHRKEGVKEPADIVNLGYVLNVIEDPAERVDTLCSAFRLAKKILIVAALINRTVDESVALQYGDGVITKRNTFQKYFDQSELQQLIEDALETTATPVALGIFYIFRDPADQQDFLSARTKRRIDWSRLSGRLGLGAPRERGRQLQTALYARNKDLLDAFARVTIELGRVPDVGEFEREAELREIIGTPKAAHRLLVGQFGTKMFDLAQEQRRGDLNVYLALANLSKTVPFWQLSERLRRDIKSFFRDYKNGLQSGREVLFAAGDSGEIELACEGVKIGLQDEQALFVHRSLLESLPPLLRVYVGCALMRYGDMAEADVIKIHKASGKVTFLLYDDFEAKPLPELRQRTKVNLRTLFVQVFDYPESPQAQLLFFKERYVAPDHPGAEQMRKFSAKLRKLGIAETLGFGPTKDEFLALAESKGLNANLNRTKRHASALIGRGDDRDKVVTSRTE